MNKVIVFGATGSVGKELLREALERGDDVSAFSRKAAPAALQKAHPEVRWIKGDVLEADAVHAAIEGHETVYCAIGNGPFGNVRTRATRNIVAAMECLGIKRLICQTTLGAGASRGNLNFYWKYLMFGGLLRAVYFDHIAQEEAIMTSSLDWTIVRPGSFTDGARSGEYRHGFASDDRGITLKISRADVAHFMRAQQEDRTYLRQCPGLSY